MTLIYSRSLDAQCLPTRAGVHAFVVGVGAYPDAKAGKGSVALLQQVKDLPSAADTAKLVVDWLIDHKELFELSLDSIELLMNEPAAGAYGWRNAVPGVAEPNTSNVIAAGKAWMARLRTCPGAMALFFSCGHGAVDGDDTTIFLSDLNKDDISPWSKFNVREAARALKKEVNVASAHFFVDACQEFIPSFELSNTGIGAQFTRAADPFGPAGIEKVTLLTAAAPATLAYEGELVGNPGVRAGRFTQTLLQAMDGASARDLSGSGDWVVHPSGIFEDLKALYRLRPEWRDRQFDPTQREMPNDIIAIMNFNTPPIVPVLVRTDPGDAISKLALSIFCNNKAPPALHACDASGRSEWIVWVKASQDPHWLIARNAAGHAYEKSFTPSRSVFTQKLKVPQ